MTNYEYQIIEAEFQRVLDEHRQNAVHKIDFYAPDARSAVDAVRAVFTSIPDDPDVFLSLPDDWNEKHCREFMPAMREGAHWVTPTKNRRIYATKGWNQPNVAGAVEFPGGSRVAAGLLMVAFTERGISFSAHNQRGELPLYIRSEIMREAGWHDNKPRPECIVESAAQEELPHDLSFYLLQTDGELPPMLENQAG